MEQLIQNTLKQNKIEGTIVKRTEGPSAILIELKIASKIKEILALEEEFSMALRSQVRITPMYKNGTVGIEIPKTVKEPVPFEILNTNHILPIYLGISPDGEKKHFDLTKAPHILTAGATGQGKSVFLNCLLASIIPTDALLLLIDPKKVEFAQYSSLNKKKFFQQILPITDTTKACAALEQLCIEMDARYDVLQHFSCRNISEYNRKGGDMPYVVCVIDEYADLVIADKNVEVSVQRLSQLARAVGIHLVVATQRPSTQIITGAIKANLPTRIAFKVGSNVDSRVILDQGGAEKLTGSGDMLFSFGVETIRIQGCHIANFEIQNIIDKCNQKQFLSELETLLKSENNPSISMLQRKLKIWGQSGFDKISEGLQLLSVS
jgi:DNA segregation ATPase FtsK/SpoIIIE, S-DNA-T family